jgi:hypothetical protein
LQAVAAESAGGSAGRQSQRDAIFASFARKFALFTLFGATDVQLTRKSRPFRPSGRRRGWDGGTNRPVDRAPV